MSRQPITDSAKRRFIAKYTKSDCGCWLWTAGANSGGYGRFWNGEAYEGAHRFAFRLDGNDLSPSADVIHSCDTPLCVNPEHLSAADAAANVEDMWSRSRAARTRMFGSTHPAAKLDDAAAAEIRRLVDGGATQVSVANLFGVGKSTIQRIASKRSWTVPSSVVIDRGQGR